MFLHSCRFFMHKCNEDVQTKSALGGNTYGIFIKHMVQEGNGNLSYTCSAGKKLVFLQVVSKVTISMISAFLVAKTFEAEVIFGGFVSKNGVQAFKTILYTVAGFSKRMVPSLIEKFENTEVKRDE